ncbi:uncharacterized protein [Montipora capricornis]|uniref:uncharacterized protein n=1 Tax=Montipora capricornis TaxID=246305 RepID=UPI0035F1EF52
MTQPRLEREGFFFRTPCSLLVTGPSGCGNTTFTRELLKHASHFMDPPPPTKHYCYGAWQPTFKMMQKEDDIHFHEGIPSLEELDAWFAPQGGGVLVLDDLMDEGGRDKRVLDLFTKHSHHRNITILYLCQDLFPPGPYAKTVSCNAHYIVCFKNPRDCTGLRALVCQAFPTEVKGVMHIFRHATEHPFGYLMFDLHPASPDDRRLWTNLLPSQGYPHVFNRGGPPVTAPLPEGEEEDDETDAMVEGPTATLVRSLRKKAHRKKGATITSGNAAETPHRPAFPPKPKCARLQVPSLSLAEQREAPLPFAEVLGLSPGSTSKEKAEIIVNKLKRQQRKKAATEVERLKSLPGWEAFDQGPSNPTQT